MVRVVGINDSSGVLPLTEIPPWGRRVLLYILGPWRTVEGFMETPHPVRFLLPLLPLAFASCQMWPTTAQRAEDAYPASIEILRAEASLHRVADENGEPLGEDFYMLRTNCLVRVENRSGKVQQVLSSFGSAFDDLRLRVRDEKGGRLATTSHTLWTDPLFEGQWYELREGPTEVELSSATLVGPAIPDDDYPLIIARQLTQTIQLEYFGGFPGSDLSRAIQSNRVTVKVNDRTEEVPRKPLPLPNEHV